MEEGEDMDEGCGELENAIDDHSRSGEGNIVGILL